MGENLNFDDNRFDKSRFALHNSSKIHFLSSQGEKIEK